MVRPPGRNRALYQRISFTLAKKGKPVVILRARRLRASDAGKAYANRAVVAQDEDLLRFVTSSFPSIWALELLLVLKRDRRWWPREDLVQAMRASDLVVNTALDSLVAGGLAAIGPDGATYMPANSDLAAAVDQVQNLYAARPDAVRRAIVRGSARGPSAFSDAFRLWGD